MRRVIGRSLVSVAALVLAGSLAAPTALAIIGGQPDGTTHPYVGMVFQETGPSTGRFIVCSGSLLSPTVVVTAGHCTSLFENSAGGQPVQVTFDSDARAFHAWTTGVAHTGPGFCVGCSQSLAGFDVGDVGVVVLDQPVVLARYASLPSPGVVDSLAHMATIINVGYGFRQPPHPPGARQRAIRYSAPADVLQIGSAPVQTTFLKTSQQLAQGSGATCGGDSGGPVLPVGGDTVLAVHSFSPSGNCTGVAYSFRIDRPTVLTWVQSYL